MSMDSVQLLKSFAEAGDALERLPKVQADLDAAHDLLNETSQTLLAERNKTDMLQATIETLRAELAQREAALADATKSQAERDQLLNSLRNLLGSGGGDNRSVSETVESQSQPSPTEDREMGNQVSALDGASAIPEANTPAYGSETHSEAEVPNPPAFPTLPLESEAPLASSNTPTANSTEPTASEATASTPPTGDADYRSYANAGYWEKPAGMTWADFEAQGGTAPSWIYDKSAA